MQEPTTTTAQKSQLQSRPDFDWQFKSGRTLDGDKFSEWVLVHASGRKLAKVSLPVIADDYDYQVFFYVAAAKRSAFADCDEGGQDLRFMDLISAQRYAERLLADCGKPVAAADTAAKPEASVLLLVTEEPKTEAPSRKTWRERLLLLFGLPGR